MSSVQNLTLTSFNNFKTYIKDLSVVIISSATANTLSLFFVEFFLGGKTCEKEFKDSIQKP